MLSMPTFMKRIFLQDVSSDLTQSKRDIITDCHNRTHQIRNKGERIVDETIYLLKTCNHPEKVKQNIQWIRENVIHLKHDKNLDALNQLYMFDNYSSTEQKSYDLLYDLSHNSEQVFVFNAVKSLIITILYVVTLIGVGLPIAVLFSIPDFIGILFMILPGIIVHCESSYIHSDDFSKALNQVNDDGSGYIHKASVSDNPHSADINYIIQEKHYV